MEYFYGLSAHSSFRQNKLLAELQMRCLPLKSVSSQYIYFVDSRSKLSQQQQQQLMHLLNARSQQLTEGQIILTVPRIGTVSPWSTKATDIANVCGLDSVTRIERGVLYVLQSRVEILPVVLQSLSDYLHDRMTESVLYDVADARQLFVYGEPKKLQYIDVLTGKHQALIDANKHLGLALTEQEIDYLVDSYKSLKRNPTDVELMMFAQVNSEHCRHKIFNADWKIDSKKQGDSLFGMIKNTHEKNPENTLLAYSDNAAILRGPDANRFFVDAADKTYRYHDEPVHMVIKVETHNHPTAISPFPGAATGSGGEIRDEGATGRGAKPKAGICGFSVSSLRIPDLPQPWEVDIGKPTHMASALNIMLEGPIGAASFNNEFGRPNIAGYFRSYEARVIAPYGEMVRGYHKPIMLAGGYGNIRAEQVKKENVVPESKLIVLGGPAMRIGLGGGAASSMMSGESLEELDFASVQRSNPEMQRRCQEVINSCWALGEDNPIISIHDVGAGGLSNALPELVHDSHCGGSFELRAIPNDEPEMAPVDIWCNESQERYVLAIDKQQVECFKKICARERCPFAIVGSATKKGQLTVHDNHFSNMPVDLPMSVLFANPPKMLRDVDRDIVKRPFFDTKKIDLIDAAQRVLQLPGVGDKSFLITIGDRSVGGLVARDQMVGPWQVPVADVGVTCTSFDGYSGEAVAIGERPPIALIHPAASARMAVGEAITNIAAANIFDISQIRLSANWMAATGFPGEDAALYEAVKAIGMELCPALGISIPVGKDSLSMRAVWQDDSEKHSVTAPLSLIITAFSVVTDVRKSLTPELKTNAGDTDLILIDLGRGSNKLGGSALTQVYERLGNEPPDVDNPEDLKHFFALIQQLNMYDYLLAYHDRSDGGLFVALCEMAFAAHTGIDVRLDDLGEDVIASLFSEELGAVIQIRSEHRQDVMNAMRAFGFERNAHVIGALNNNDRIVFNYGAKEVLAEDRIVWQRMWSETSYHMKKMRDNPDCAQQEFDLLLDKKDPGLSVDFGNHSSTFELRRQPLSIDNACLPKIAILREQGVNGHVEMAAAFDRAGFECIDVHMTDIFAGRVNLSQFAGLVACGGFSYGDVLGAGRGWANSILHHEQARDMFKAFFERNDTFALGVCNGCQMLSHLRGLIPGSGHWPIFERNASEQFEARLSLVEINKSPSIFFKGMENWRLPIAVSHGEGCAQFKKASPKNLVAMHYVDNCGAVTERYPANPNGSPKGITALTTTDGRVTIMMPHPERVFRTVQWSWHPSGWSEDSPWMQMFFNAREWVGEKLSNKAAQVNT